MRSCRRSVASRIVGIDPSIGWSPTTGKFVSVGKSNISGVIVATERRTALFRRSSGDGRFRRQAVIVCVCIVDDHLLLLLVTRTATFHVCINQRKMNESSIVINKRTIYSGSPLMTYDWLHRPRRQRSAGR